MSMHSVPFYDMAKLSTFKDHTGREYQALQWNGDTPAGHHRSGVLEFPAIATLKNPWFRVKDNGDT